MLPREIMKKVRHIEIYTRRIVNDIMAGRYHSVFRGRGIELSEVRPYIPGDEIRTIDWNVTARMGEPYVKLFAEERELTIMLMVDLSGSGDFGSRVQLKRELASELSAILAFSAIKNNDKVGLIIFTDRIEKFLPPKKGTRHILRLIREVLYFDPEGRGTDLALPLDYLARVMTRRTVAFLISDYAARGYEKAMRIVSKKHDLIAVTITDPIEKDLPSVGMIRLRDAETGETMLLDTSSADVRWRYMRNARAIADERDGLFRSAGVDAIHLRNDQPYVSDLLKFFRMRAMRR